MSEMTGCFGSACSGMALACVVGIGSLLHGQPVRKGEEEIAKTLSDWSARNKRFRSIRYVLSGKTERKDLPSNSKLPSEQPVRYVVLIDFARGRLRMEINSSGPDPNYERYIRNASVCTYDGEALHQNISREASESGPTNPNVCLTKGPLDRMPIDSTVWPVLFAHGVVPTVNKPARPDKLPVERLAEEFESRGNVTHQGNQCLILRTDPVASIPFVVDELWIDSARESAIVRYINFTGKNPWYIFDINYKKSKHGWLPSSWITTNIGVTHLVVESLELNPVCSDSDFSLPIKAGSIVATSNYPEPGKGLDPFKPAMAVFRVEEDGSWTTLEESGFATADGIPLPPKSQDRHWIWWTGGTLLAVVLFTIAALFYRRWMRRLPSS